MYTLDVNGSNGPTVLKVILSGEGVPNPLEIDLSFRLQHPNLLGGLDLYIPPFGDSCFTPYEYGILYPLMDESAHNLLYNTPDDRNNARDRVKRAKFPFATRLDLFRQVCLGVQALHANGIAHIDLKLGNILVKGPDDHDTVGYRALVADYGSCVYLGNSHRVDSGGFFSEGILTTRTTRPPENMAGSQRYGFWSDIWSLGITGLELLTGVEISHSFRFYLGLIQAARNNNPRLKIPSTYWVTDIIEFIWPKLRYTERELLETARKASNSPWLTQEGRRQKIRTLLVDAGAGQLTDDLTNLFMKMLTIAPQERPAIEWVCQRLGIEPIPTQARVTQTTPENYSWAREQVEGLSVPDDAYMLIDLPQNAISKVIDLVALANAVIVPTTDQEITAMIVTCFWIVHKMRGNVYDFDELVDQASSLFGWSDQPDDHDELDEVIVPWQRGTPVVRSTILTMERMIITGVDGVLLGELVVESQ